MGPLQVDLLIKIISSFNLSSLGYTVLSCRAIPHTVLVTNLELMFLDSYDHKDIHVRRRDSSNISKVEMNSFHEILNMLAFEGDPDSL